MLSLTSLVHAQLHTFHHNEDLCRTHVLPEGLVPATPLQDFWLSGCGLSEWRRFEPLQLQLLLLLGLPSVRPSSAFC